MAMLEVRDLRKSFYTYAKPGLQAGIFHKPGARKVVSQLDVLKGVDLTVNKGDVVAILGPSARARPRSCAASTFWKQPTAAP